MRYLIGTMLLAALLGCPNPNPTPTPTPSPTPTPPTINHPELLLRQNGGVITRGGLPHSVFGAIPCWDPEEKDHGGWTGFDQKWVDYAVGKGANAFHMRLGPYPTDSRWPNSLQYGMSNYINDDAAQGFNQAWWDKALAEVQYAESKGANVQIDLIDGWQCRHAITDPLPSPWRREDLVACANTFTPTHRAFVRKAVETFGCEAGVIWEDGNEIGQASAAQGPYKPAWTLAIVDEVRKAEQEVGCGVVHMFGTNSGKDEVEASSKIDYIATHDKSLITGPRYGKWLINNEHNPPFSPTEERTAFCTAKNAGQAWWYWRGAQTQADMEQTLSLFGVDCSAFVNTCPAPNPDPALLNWKTKPSGQWYDPTPTVDSCEYCKAIGMGEYNGQVRCNCPARNECPGFQCEFRVACEQVLMQAPLPVWRSDGTVILDTNGWRAKCESCTYLEVCNGPLDNCRKAF